LQSGVIIAYKEVLCN